MSWISFEAQATHHLCVFVVRIGRMMGFGRRVRMDDRGPPVKTRRTGRIACPSVGLLSDTELIDDDAITLVVGLLEVIEKTAPAADEFQKSAAAVVIFRVRLEMLRQIGNSVREECDLHFWGTGIAIVSGVMGYQLCFLLLVGG